ncbi:SpoIIIAH-like family protein [Clostridiaceae bacterium NSJ-31]|uniref:SpoIIIAH-like family protein n=1 Tax=Ligaoa zhengdingensis TaxID=2763658 RepID=A0A926DXM5_9FIRM|nr:SpoIIIAH-like family protein [Ligaoa zhengdingensis]MBC8545482.1 SpoIIIAH-like family protein [Ligaoa zhengdingensis]
MNMILGKRHIILAALVLSLGIAVYLNWVYSTSGGDFVATETAATGESKNYGDSKYVSLDGEEVQVVANSAYFKEARLNRTKSRDEAVDSIKKMFKDASLTDEEKSALAVQATDIAQAIETEGTMENLIKAKGYEDCLVYMADNKVDIVVKSEGLQKEDVAKIKDIVLAQTDVPVENISITETK